MNKQTKCCHDRCVRPGIYKEKSFRNKKLKDKIRYPVITSFKLQVTCFPFSSNQEKSMKKFIRSITFFMGLMLFLGQISFAQISKNDIKKIENALPSATIVKTNKVYKILVFARTEGYRHDSIPFAAKAFELMGKKNGLFETVYSEDMAVFEAGYLNQFDAVLLNNTTRLNFENPQYKKNLTDFVKQGKGLMGIHAATDNFYHWHQAAEMMGGVFNGHPWNSSGSWKVKIDDKKNVLNSHFKGKDFRVNDEIYRISQRNLRDNYRVLLSLDMKDTKNLSAGGVTITDRDLPISWIGPYGKGRIFYSGFGHNRHIFWNPAILQHYLNGIQYVLGDLNANEIPLKFDIEKTIEINEITTLLNSIKNYEYGQSRENLTNTRELIRLVSVSKKLSLDVEKELIQFLKSTATIAAKQFACEELNLIGSKQSIPTLMHMLNDTATAEMALFALMPIKDDKVAEGLRTAFDKAPKALKIAMINALGNRADKASLAKIIPLMKDQDSEIALPSIAAVGKIGGIDAANALSELREKGLHLVNVNAAYLECAGKFNREDKEDGFQIFKKIYDTEDAYHVRFAALRGMILTSGKNASENIIHVLKSDEQEMYSGAIQLIPIIPSSEDVSAIVKMAPGLTDQNKVKLLSALAGRKNNLVTEFMLKSANNKNPNIRIAAFMALTFSGDARAVAVLAKAGAFYKGAERDAAREGLYKLNGSDIEKEIMGSLPKTKSKIKIEYIKAVQKRQMTKAIQLLVSTLEDDNKKVRLESIKAINKIAPSSELDAIVKHLTTPKSEQERTALEKAVVAIALRIPVGSSHVSSLLKQLKKTQDVKVKASLLKVSGKIGDSSALPVIRTALKNENNEIKTSAIRALSDWPTGETLDDLYKTAKSSTNETHRILALRGYIKLISQSSEKSGEELLKLYSNAMQLAKTVKEKQAVLAGLSIVKSMDALQFSKEYLTNPELQQEAGTAIINIGSGLKEGELTEIKPLILQVRSLIESESLQEKADELINITERFEDFITTWKISGPYDLENEDLFVYSFLPETADEKNAEWKIVSKLTDENRYWHVDLSKVYPNQGLVAYLKTNVWSDKKQELQLEIGSNDMVKAWLNSKLVHANDVSRTITAGEDKLKVTLNKGWNSLMLKIVNEGGGWGGCARFRNLNGGHIDGLKFSINK